MMLIHEFLSGSYWSPGMMEIHNLDAYASS